MQRDPDPASSDGPLIDSELPLGRPGIVAHDELVLRGWAASQKGVAGVVVQIDDRQWNAGYGFDTPQLPAELDGAPGADRAGYALRVDTSGWTPGPRHVTIAAFDVDGGRSAIEGEVEFRPLAASREEPPSGDGALGREQMAFSLDSPAIATGTPEIEGAVEISGWAHAEEGIEAVVVTLDGVVQYEALRPIMRPDLLGEHGRDVAAGAGFTLRIDPADCPPGRHSLAVSALSRDGRAVGVEGDILCRTAPEARQAWDAGSATPVDWMPERVAAERREESGEVDDTTRMWQDRALLAEADAALCRAEANLARTAQEATLRSAQRDPGAKPATTEAIRGKLAMAQEELAAGREKLEAAQEELARARDDAAAREAALGRVENSLSWRITRPLRFFKRAWLPRG